MVDHSAPQNGWSIHNDDGFLELVGPVYERWHNERLELAFTAAGKHRNKTGVVQGGMLVTLADRAMGVAAYVAAGKRPVATIQLDTHFLAGAPLEQFIVARPDVIRATRSLVFLEARVVTNERTLLSAKGVWKILGRG